LEATVAVDDGGPAAVEFHVPRRDLEVRHARAVLRAYEVLADGVGRRVEEVGRALEGGRGRTTDLAVRKRGRRQEAGYAEEVGIAVVGIDALGLDLGKFRRAAERRALPLARRGRQHLL